MIKQYTNTDYQSRGIIFFNIANIKNWKNQNWGNNYWDSQTIVRPGRKCCPGSSRNSSDISDMCSASPPQSSDQRFFPADFCWWSHQNISFLNIENYYNLKNLNKVSYLKCGKDLPKDGQHSLWLCWSHPEFRSETHRFDLRTLHCPRSQESQKILEWRKFRLI